MFLNAFLIKSYTLYTLPSTLCFHSLHYLILPYICFYIGYDKQESNKGGFVLLTFCPTLLCSGIDDSC